MRVMAKGMIDPETLYVQLGHLLASVPDFAAPGPLSNDAKQWLARAYALVQAAGDKDDTSEMKKVTDNFNELIFRQMAAEPMLTILRRTAAVAELKSPSAVQGTFIHAGNVFDAMVALGKVLQSATRDIVDPYMDEKALSDFAFLVPEKVPMRLLSDSQSVKPTLRPAYERWVKQYGPTRRLTVKLAPARTLHDRVIIIDGAAAYVSTQSLNAIAVRSPASIMRADAETAALKIQACETIWNSSAPL
jgi:hypothetical protein